MTEDIYIKRYLMKNKLLNKNLIIACILSVLIAVAYIIIGNYKETLWLDEIYTYSLANNDAFEIFDESTRVYAGDEIIRDYMTVEEGHAFDFKMVYENQVKDVHPPLYYMFVHFFSSFAPYSYSRLYALVPNIIFAVIVYWQMVWMFRQFCKNKLLSLVFAGLYLFTMCFVNNVMLFRMYVLLTVMTNFLVIIFIKYKPWKQHTKWFYISLFFTILGGMQTQYYFSVIAASVCLIYAVFLLYYNKIKELILYVITGLAGVGASIVVFPATLDHIFEGYRGEEAFQSFADSSLSNVKVLFEIFNRQLFGNMILLIVAIIVILLIVSLCKNNKVNSEIVYIMLQITLPVVIYLCVISKVAPYLTDRYIFNVSGLLYISVFGIFLILADKFGKKGIILSVLMATAVLVSSYQDGIPYLNRYEEDHRNAVAQMSSVPCVYVYSNSAYKCIPYYMDLADYDTVMLLAEWHEDYVDWWDYTDEDKLVIYLDTTDNSTQVLDRIVKYSTTMTEYSKLYDAGGFSVYLVD